MDDEHAAALLAEKFTSPIRQQKSENMFVTTPVADREPVQAYAKLEGDTFSYFIRTLQVTLGRKAANSENADITLGTAKSISRHHAKVYYNFLNQRFELIIQGKNGAFINDQFVEKGTTIPLEHRTKIQIGEVAFYFLLPKADSTENTLSAPTSVIKGTTIRDFSSVDSPNRKPGPGQLSTFDDIHMPDYTNVKPPYSYASLIAQAINSTTTKKMTLNGIYNYITSHYPYYQLAQNGWQNSIRHNLSLNKAFVKVPRADGEPGKGAFWTIDQNYEGQFSNGVYKRNRRSSKTSRENSASPFTSPVKTRRKSVSTSLEAGSLLSPGLIPPKFPTISTTTAPPPPPPVFFSNLSKESTSGNPTELQRKKPIEEPAAKEPILTPPPSQTPDCGVQEVKTEAPELPKLQTSDVHRETSGSPTRSLQSTADLSPPTSQPLEQHERSNSTASEGSATSNKQPEPTETST